jgi:hypothetical protein
MQDKQQAKPAAAPLSRRTPVKAPGSGGPPWAPIAMIGGVAAVVLLIVYLLVQASGGGDGLSGPEKAEQDDNPDLPGVFHPTQGRGHFPYTFSLERDPRPFCEGVIHSGDDATPSGAATVVSTSTPQPSATPQATGSVTAAGTAGSTTPAATPTQRTDCYNSNPPSSGQHLGVQRNVDVTGTGVFMNIPADPDVYEDDVLIPREAVAHILEHAGVFVGYNCAASDQACLDVVEQLKDLVNDRIDNNNDRVVMAHYLDLPEGEIGVSSWTRALNMKAAEYDQNAVEDFIGTHSCRFDPEGFC